MKYIDAEKLIAEIERRRLSNRYIDTEGYENELMEIITSLQQEQPEVDLDKAAGWSEEDENALTYLHELIDFGLTEKFFDTQTAADMRKWLNARLKSLRPDTFRNKPSEEQPETDLLEEAYMRGFAQGAKEERERMLEDIAKLSDTAEKRGLNFGAECGFQIALDELEQRLTGKH